MSYYEVLGILSDADTKTIKQAYWKLAGVHHPDKGGDESIFKRVCEAYGVLSDPEKRKHYDQNGSMEGFKDDKETAIERLQTLVGNIIHQHGFMADHTDLIRRLREEINEITLDIENKLESSKLMVRRYDSIIPRINNAEFLTAHVVEAKARVEDNIKEYLKDLEIQNLMHELIKDAAYAVDPDEELPNGKDIKICEKEEGQEV